MNRLNAEEIHTLDELALDEEMVGKSLQVAVAYANNRYAQIARQRAALVRRIADRLNIPPEDRHQITIDGPFLVLTRPEESGGEQSDG